MINPDKKKNKKTYTAYFGPSAEHKPVKIIKRCSDAEYGNCTTGAGALRASPGSKLVAAFFFCLRYQVSKSHAPTAPNGSIEVHLYSKKVLFRLVSCLLGDFYMRW